MPITVPLACLNALKAAHLDQDLERAGLKGSFQAALHAWGDRKQAKFGSRAAVTPLFRGSQKFFFVYFEVPGGSNFFDLGPDMHHIQWQ